ncbi:DUF3558 family protein [Streptomyces koyangensis]|uniref:DUF3558 family protein n=1 Tax=Streptomyces koyangensis TaxID=188770 RepID=A0ABX7EEE6_9ACTN|nr:DUF3558 family protein [Streptomyces koyangensis]QRF02908.1 DUF3558 family protein [Streptomyces koyangensis]
MHRPAQRLTRILACAAVPVMLVAAGCSSDDSSDGGNAQQDKPASSPAASAPAVEKAAYSTLPEACATLSKKTLRDLVPDADNLKGKTGKSDDTASRATCSWNSLDNKGVDGSQFRWLHVSLMRFDSDEALGSGEERAEKYYAKQIADAKATEDAQEVATEPVSGTGDAATVVSYELKKKEGTFKQQSLVTRVENVVVTVDYNGAGLAGQSSPKTKGLVEDATKAGKEAVAAVTKANSKDTKDSSGEDSAKEPEKDTGKKSEKDDDENAGQGADPGKS